MTPKWSSPERRPRDTKIFWITIALVGIALVILTVVLALTRPWAG